MLHLPSHLLDCVQVRAFGGPECHFHPALHCLQSLSDGPRPVLRGPVGYDPHPAEPFVGLPQAVDKLVLAELGVPIEEPLPVGCEHPEDDHLGAGSREHVGGAPAPFGVDALARPGVCDNDRLVLRAHRATCFCLSLIRAVPSCGTTLSSSGWPG